MKITVLDDYFDTVRTLKFFEELAGHEVTVVRRPRMFDPVRTLRAHIMAASSSCLRHAAD